MSRYGLVPPPHTSKPPTPPARHMRPPPAPKGAPLKKLHPALQQRADWVKEAHAHLSAAVPEYNQAPARQRMMMTQEHIRARQGKR